MRLFTLFLFAALVVTSLDAASYQKTDGTIVDPIQSVSGGNHVYDSYNLQPYADLHSANLRHAYLRSANLTGVNLTDASLSQADLSQADLREANLTGADLTGADLTRTTLTNATLAAAVSRLSGLSTTGAFNAWQKILNPGVNASADITQVSVMLSNTGAPVSVVLKIYDGESDALSVNPYTRFDGLTPVATSPAVSVSTATRDPVSFEFDLSAYTLTANTYSFWLQESGDGFLGGVIVQQDIAGSDGGSGNNWGTLNHEVLSNANLSNATFGTDTILYDGQTVAQHGFDAAGLEAYLEAAPLNALGADNLTIIPEPTTLLLALLALVAAPLRVRCG
jgi:uncharacterized protein YjbI with pentapeptide repeats